MNDNAKKIVGIISSLGVAGAIGAGVLVSNPKACDKVPLSVGEEVLCLDQEQYSDLKANLYMKVKGQEELEWDELLMVTEMINRDIKQLREVNVQNVNSQNVMEKVLDRATSNR